MKTPSQRRLKADLADGPFKMGEADKKWGLTEDPDKTWPYALFWVKAGERQNAPDRFTLWNSGDTILNYLLPLHAFREYDDVR